ncbi:MAG: class I SAM-dependent methyltransferase [Spirochaetales bacterium]|nr:class I SAM-dependent methyltransferase [Spirochaetales bacterium]
MVEIYERHADRYDELVAAEDYRGNVKATLHRIAAWEGAEVIEAGVGTGRVTKLYIDTAARAVCCDRSRHMLDYTRATLTAYASKITYSVADNMQFPRIEGDFDLFIEGWSFGHSAMESSDDEDLVRITERLVGGAERNLVPGGTAIVLETLGTNVDEAAAPHPTLKRFYDLLEREHGFVREEIRTDYRFETVDDAARVMGFFFGPGMERGVRERSSTTIPEWTGVWSKRVASPS